MKPRVKVSISLANELLDAIDLEAERKALSRSHIIELWLKLASRRRAAQELEQETIDYYRERTAAQREDDEDWASQSARAARTLKVDSPLKTRRSA